MGRENCQMCHYLGNDVYCDYYDVFFAACESVEVCPDGLDDEDEYDEEYCEDDMGEWE